MQHSGHTDQNLRTNELMVEIYSKSLVKTLAHETELKHQLIQTKVMQSCFSHFSNFMLYHIPHQVV